jgi:predicted metalloprotease
MRMDGQEESQNVEDVRGMGGGGGGGFGLGGRSIGLGTVVVALVAGWIFGINPLTLLGLADGGAPVAQTAPEGPLPKPPTDDQQALFVSQVLRSTETVWTEVFKEAGKQYVAPKLVIFRDSWRTACGQGQAAMGPFYCPEDGKVYIDLAFYDVMQTKLKAPGQFARAYVVGHEVGHHVQTQLGIMRKVDSMRQRASSEAQANALSVRVELQADCLAGVWTQRSQAEMGWRLEPGDVETALNAAAQIGDDTLQRKSQGAVVPESFTHGTSQQRVTWFKRGLDSGRVDQCDTLSTREL